MAENPRIDELRRRVQNEPGSIAFAQLAEEHRRLGEFEQAVQVCRDGLGQHPGYVSARVTLGRALLEMGRYDEARAELEDALHTAPDNLAAIRALSEIHQRKGQTPEAGGQESHDPAPLTSDLSPLTSDLRPLPSDLRPPTSDPVLTELESWLAAILADRQRR